MGTRLEFQSKLEDLLGTGNVYFQPPPDQQIAYPAIVYNRYFMTIEFADNFPYAQNNRYRVTVIDADPDSLIPPKVASLPMTTFVRHYTADHLNHDVFDVFF